MRSAKAFYFIVLCALAFGWHVIVSVPEFGMPIKPVVPIVEDLSRCFRNFLFEDVFWLVTRLICVSIGYTFSYGAIGWFLCRVFPIGSSLEMLQAWDVLPLLLPLLELSESTLFALSNVNKISPYVSWPFFVGWLQGVHFIAYWLSIFLLLCSMIYAALIQLSGRSTPSLRTSYSIEQQLRTTESELQSLREQNQNLVAQQQLISTLASKLRSAGNTDPSEIAMLLSQIETKAPQLTSTLPHKEKES